MNKQDQYTIDLLQRLQRGPKTYESIQKSWYRDGVSGFHHASMIAKALRILARHEIVDAKLPKGYTSADYRKATEAFSKALSLLARGEKPSKKIVTSPPPCAYCLTPMGKLIARNLR